MQNWLNPDQYFVTAGEYSVNMALVALFPHSEIKLLMSAFELLAAEVLVPRIGLNPLGLLCSIPGGIIGLMFTAFHIWMLVDCLINESSQGNDKLVWALVIFFMPCLGSVLYFFIRRPARRAQLGR